MKRHLRTTRSAAFLAILIAVAALGSDQAVEEPEESWKENFIVPHVYLEVEIIPSSIAHITVILLSVILGICG